MFEGLREAGGGDVARGAGVEDFEGFAHVV